MFLENAYCGAPISFDSFSRSFSLIAICSSLRRALFLAKITISCRIKYINRVSNSALSHVTLALCSAH